MELRSVRIKVKVKVKSLSHVWLFAIPWIQQWPQDQKRSVFIPIPKKGTPKECSNYRTIALISHANKVMLKILQARLQQYVNCELPDVQAGFRKGRGAWEGLCQGDTSQSILKETNPKYSLKGLMLKLQYFGHLMRGSDSLENILIWERLKAK